MTNSETVRLAIRPRGVTTTRLDTFVDAAFAFALTLLVISFDQMPSSLTELQEALRTTPAFAASFAQLTMFWLGHRHWSRHFGLETSSTVFFSLLLVFTALVYVYPLRVLYAVFFEWLSNGWLPSAFQLTSFDELSTLFVIYGVGYFAFSGCLVLLYLAAFRAREALSLTVVETQATLSELSGWTIVAIAGLVSAALAALLPARLAGWAGGFYGVLSFLMPLNYWWFQRRARRLTEQSEDRSDGSVASGDEPAG